VQRFGPRKDKATSLILISAPARIRRFENGLAAPSLDDKADEFGWYLASTVEQFGLSSGRCGGA
jgi:hypothetical protein